MVAPSVGILARTHPVERNSSYRGHIAFASFEGYEDIFQYPGATQQRITLRSEKSSAHVIEAISLSFSFAAPRKKNKQKTYPKGVRIAQAALRGEECPAEKT